MTYTEFDSPINPKPLKGFPNPPAVRKVHTVFPSDILDRTFRYLKDAGWGQGFLVKKAPMTQTTRCILGAIDAAAHDLGVPEYGKVTLAARDIFLKANGIRNIPGWNDTKGRTKAQVLEALDRSVYLALALEK